MATSVENTSSTTIGPDGSVKRSSSTRTIHHSAPEPQSPSDPLVARLRSAGQDHVLSFWAELSVADRAALEDDVSAVDVEARSRWHSAATRYSDSPDGREAKLEPIPQRSVLPQPTHATRSGWVTFRGADLRLISIVVCGEQIVTITSVEPTATVLKCREIGLQKVGEGKVAAILMAGGQGTRLGSNKPKGSRSDPLPAASSSVASTYRAGKSGDRYIMTSGATQKETVAFLEANKYFGLDPADVFIFEQNLIPCLTTKGKMILKSKHALARAPDGNGDLYRAVREAGALADMEKRGVEYVHIYGVDNALVQIADPIFVGTVAHTNADVGNKSCLKSSPNEKVGVICIKNGKYQVVEYSEMDEATCALRREDGQLLFAAGNICNHVYTKQFLRKAYPGVKYYVLHVNNARITLDRLVQPKEPNGIKLEKFVFDVFVLAKKLTVLEISRDEEFSPLKNASAAGSDCVETVRKMIYTRNRRYLAAAGATFVDATGSALDPATLTEEHVCEISPLVSYAGEGLENIVKTQSPFMFPIRIRP